MKNKFCFVAILIFTIVFHNYSFSLAKGIIEGTVVETKTGERIPGANIIISNTLYGAPSDVEGKYTITGIDIGTYTLKCQMIGYKTITVDSVIIENDKPIEIEFVLSPDTLGAREELGILYKSAVKLNNKKKLLDIDLDFVITMDSSMDPDIIIAADPSVDPGIIINSVKPSLKNLHKKSVNLRILDHKKNTEHKMNDK